MQESTLKKLSEVLGISISTVSRALKNHPDISQTTKTKVKELAVALEYEPNIYAVQLRTQRSNVLGILVPCLDNFFYDAFITAVEQNARQHGYSVMIMQTGDKAQLEIDNLQHLRKSMMAGVFASIATETQDISPFNKVMERNIPVIFFDRVPAEEGYHKVCMADTHAAKLAAEAIAKKKKKNVLGLFGHPRLSITKSRLESFQETLSSLSPNTKLSIDYTPSIEESKQSALKALQSNNKPDTIFCMGDLTLIGVMYVVHELNLKVPEDIAIISISNGFIPNLYNPKITYVETNGFKLGNLAFKSMLAALENSEGKPQQLTVESILVEGGSL